MYCAVLSLAAVLALGAGIGSAGEEKRSARNERTLRELRTRVDSVRKLSANDELSQFMLGEARRLLERSRTLAMGSYELHRVLEALDDLMDACDDVADASNRSRDDDQKNARQDTARRLERAYFRVQQGDYFGRLSGDDHAPGYILRSRQLYQKARSAYDRSEYGKARKLASASAELVNVLENLAHAAAPRPDPPVLK